MKFSLGNLPPWIESLFALLSNRYVLVLSLFAIWVGIFDANSLVNILSARSRVKALKEKKEYYQMQIDDEERRLNELRTNPENLEKFAREQYFMRRPNEDVYVVVE
ncbi:MAG: FtsB family cell division protein [Bacteroides sp.]